jgi:hypothetical protein
MGIEKNHDTNTESLNLADWVIQKNQTHAVGHTVQSKPEIKGILSIFHSVKNHLSQRKMNKELKALKQEQEKMAQGFLQTQMYEPYLMMMSNGYKPTLKQQITMDNHCNDLMNSNFIEGLQKIDHYNEMGMPVSRTLIGPLLFNHHSDGLLELGLLNNEKDYMVWGLEYFSKEYKKALQAPTLSSDLMLFWKTKVKQHIDLIENDKAYITAYKDNARREIFHINSVMNILITANPALFIAKTPMKEMMEIITENQKLIGLIYNHDKYTNERRDFESLVKDILPHKIGQYYKEEISNKMKVTRSIYNTDLQEMALQKAQENLNNPQYNVLPEQAQQKVKQIEDLYQKLHAEKSQDKLEQAGNIQEEFEIENVFQKRLPEVLEKYLSIHQDYRDTMKHMQTGKTAYEMMMESLDNYQLKLQTILDEKNQSKLSEMNVTNIYSKKINNM